MRAVFICTEANESMGTTIKAMAMLFTLPDGWIDHPAPTGSIAFAAPNANQRMYLRVVKVTGQTTRAAMATVQGMCELAFGSDPEHTWSHVERAHGLREGVPFSLLKLIETSSCDGRMMVAYGRGSFVYHLSLHEDGAGHDAQCFSDLLASVDFDTSN